MAGAAAVLLRHRRPLTSAASLFSFMFRRSSQFCKVPSECLQFYNYKDTLISGQLQSVPRHDNKIGMVYTQPRLLNYQSLNADSARSSTKVVTKLKESTVEIKIPSKENLDQKLSKEEIQVQYAEEELTEEQRSAKSADHSPIVKAAQKSPSTETKKSTGDAQPKKEHSSVGSSDQNKRPKRIPKIILLQNPFKWLMIKVDFSVLKAILDPLFDEKEFKSGTRQAISRITQVVSKGCYEELQGLLTKPARLCLVRELERHWNCHQRALLSLTLDNIQVSSPRKVYFIRMGDKKFCDVDMAFVALKWVPINNIDALILTEIFARFHRDYSPYSIPEWTIAYFKIMRFEIVKRSPL